MNDYDLHYDKLVQKYKESITSFTQTQYVNLNSKEISDIINKYKIIKIDTNSITFVILKNLIESKFKEFFNKNPINYNYLEYINNPDNTDENKKKFWLLREWLLYQILYITSIVITNNNFFKIIYHNININIFRNLTDTLQGYKLGIYGSKNITSDIDVGIYYDSKNLQNLNGGTAYIISILENMFHIFLGVSSIILDIEFYADYTMIRDIGGNEIFYINTSTFKIENFITILSILYASIARNYIFAIQYINKLFNINLHYDVNILINLFNNTYKWNNKDYSVAKVFTMFIKDVLQPLLPSDKTFSNVFFIREGFRLALNYTNIKELKKTEDYYQKSKDAEVAMQYYNEKIYYNHYTDDERNSELAKLINLIGYALIDREESYVTPMTVMDVVYDGQKFKNSKRKYEFGFCNKDENKKQIYCLLGKFGYICSMIEQLGYLFRYYLIYSENNIIPIDANKQTPKITKYLTRFEDALSKYNSIMQNSNLQINGGFRKIKITKKTKKFIKKQYKQHNNIHPKVRSSYLTILNKHSKTSVRKSAKILGKYY